MSANVIRTSITAIIFLLIGVAIASPYFMGDAQASGSVSEAAALTSSPQVSAAAAGATWTMCTPVNVAVFAKRVHVKCSETVGGIQYFAAPTEDDSHAARVLSTLTASHVSGSTLSVLYDPADESGAAIGCNASDCRMILGVANLN